MLAIKKVTLFLILLFFPFNTWADCTIGDFSGVTSEADQRAMKFLGLGWLKNAKICRVGPYEVAAPANTNDTVGSPILILKDGKPLLHRAKGSTMIFNPNLDKADFNHPIVNIWHSYRNDDIERLWYQTVPDEQQRYIMVYDLDFNGQPDTKTTWQKGDIVESYAWYKDRWHKMKDGCIIIEDKCFSAKFDNGQWQLQNKNQ